MVCFVLIERCRFMLICLFMFDMITDDAHRNGLLMMTFMLMPLMRPDVHVDDDEERETRGEERCREGGAATPAAGKYCTPPDIPGAPMNTTTFSLPPPLLLLPLLLPPTREENSRQARKRRQRKGAAAASRWRAQTGWRSFNNVNKTSRALMAQVGTSAGDDELMT